MDDQSKIASGSYWPAELPVRETLETFVELFRNLGFAECDSAAEESGYVKIAIYVNAAGVPTHAARQTRDGWWGSKLGPSFDIEHSTLEAVGGYERHGYGRVAVVMRRRLGEGEDLAH